MCLLASCVFRQQKGVSYSTIAELLEFTSAALKRKERHRLQGGQWIEPSGICGLTWYLLLDLTTKPLLLAPLRPLHYMYLPTFIKYHTPVPYLLFFLLHLKQPPTYTPSPFTTSAANTLETAARTERTQFCTTHSNLVSTVSHFTLRYDIS